MTGSLVQIGSEPKKVNKEDYSSLDNAEVSKKTREILNSNEENKSLFEGKLVENYVGSKSSLKKKITKLKWAKNFAVNQLHQKIFFNSNTAKYKPNFIVLDITQNCTSRCITCDIWKTKNENELTTEDFLKIIDEVADWLGTCKIVLCGGEPMLRKDIFDFIKKIKSRGCIAMMITNGMLCTSRNLDKLKEAGIDEITFSVNGITPHVHDVTRGIPGNLQQIVKAIKHLQENAPEIDIFLGPIVMGYNKNDVIKLVEWAKENHLRGVKFNAMDQIIPGDYTKKRGPPELLNNDLWPKDFDEMDKALDTLKEMKRDGYPIVTSEAVLELYKKYFRNPNYNMVHAAGQICTVGVSTMIIEPDGNIFVCFKHPPIGNLKGSSVRGVWEGHTAMLQREAIKKCRVPCGPVKCTTREGFFKNAVAFTKFFS